VKILFPVQKCGIIPLKKSIKLPLVVTMGTAGQQLFLRTKAKAKNTSGSCQYREFQ
jgi:hypothetical protein